MSIKVYTSVDMETFLAQEDKDYDEWIIEDFIPRDTFVLLSGLPKRGRKTFTATTLGMVAATGVTYGKIKATNKHSVVLVAAEGRESDIRDACRKIKGMLRVEDTSNLHIIYLEDTMKLDVETDQKGLLAFVKKHKPELLIMDNWTYFKKGNENDVEAMMPVYDTLQTIRAMGTTVLMLCHLNKSSEKKYEGAYPDMDDEIRGSTILAGAYDVHLALRTRGKKKGGELYLLRRGKAVAEDVRDVFWLIDNTSCQLTISDSRDEI